VESAGSGKLRLYVGKLFNRWGTTTRSLFTRTYALPCTNKYSY